MVDKLQLDIGSQVANGIGQSGQGVIDFGSQVANGVGESGQGVLDFFGNLGSGLTDFFSSFAQNQNMPGASGGGGGGSGINYFDQFNELLSNALNFAGNNNQDNNQSEPYNPYATQTIGHLPTGEAVYSGFSPVGYIPNNNNNNDNMDMSNNPVDNIGGALSGAGDYLNDALTGAGNYLQSGFDNLFGGGNSSPEPDNSPGPATSYLPTGEPIYPGFSPL